MNEKKLLRFAIDAGELTLTSGAEAYRAEETILRILETKYEKTSASFAVGTGLFASVHSEEGKDYTTLRRIKKRNIDLDRLSAINAVSRGFVKGEITLKEGEIEIEKIKAKTQGRAFSMMLGVSFGAFFFSPLMGGSLKDSGAALFIGFILSLILLQLEKRSVGVFFTNLVGGVAIALLTSVLSHLNLLNKIDAVIISSLMPLLPGAAFTSAVRDIVEEDYLSGTSRAMEAVIVAVSIVSGVSIGLSILNPRLLPYVASGVSLNHPFIKILSASLATFFFSVMFKSPKEERQITAVVGGVGWSFLTIATNFSSSPGICAFVGTLAVAFLSRYMAVARKKPQTVFFLPGIIPYVPGAGVYYTMEAIKNQNLNLAMSKGLETVTIAGAIAVAVAVIQLLPPRLFTFLKPGSRKN